MPPRCLWIVAAGLLVPQCSHNAVVALQIDAGTGLTVDIDASGGSSVSLDGDRWLLPGSAATTFLGAPATLLHMSSVGPGRADMHWASNATGTPLPVHTSVFVGPVPGSLIFRQTWPQGWQWRPAAAAAAAAPPPSTCGAVLHGADQSGGHVCCGTPNERVGGFISGFRNYTQAQCCAACLAASQCNAYITAPPTVAGANGTSRCWLIAEAHGSHFRSDRSMGAIVGRPSCSGKGCAQDQGQDKVLAGFPTFENAASQASLNVLGWGGCQLSPGHGQDDVGTHIQRWTGGSPVANSAGLTPMLLFNKAGRAAVLSPANNFFVGIHSTADIAHPKLLQAGIKASVRSIPANFTHDTLLFAGHGINDTLVGFGDVLLARSGKQRVQPYADFILSHLGHWNDAGAYYYHNPAPFENYQEALLAVKADAVARKIPFRYSQWCDCQHCAGVKLI